MFLPKIKKYQKKYSYSYAFGSYPVLEILKKHSDKILLILFKQEGLESSATKEILELAQQKKIKTEINSKLIDKIAVKENTYVVAVFKKYDTVLDSDENHLVLVNPTNKGNLGTVIRTMLGFNFKNLGIINPSVDIFDPMVVRATMGGLFSINFMHYGTIDDYIKQFPNHNLYPFMLKGESNILDTVFKKPFTIIQGNESRGLDDRYLELGESVYIPHSKDIDSLNLSIASGISLWEASKDSLEFRR
ncbi:TrmH family RNA methyltransferase [Candidatus Dojkabacteria bacterium]|uniref:TrmH family RNA methyltransferase n=1 Tax=Candidatus Dojkabacteria bacterium TaxID=2099670 RepID=A0A847VDH4_9BACT|nr:TrmH family RNA methyltransferase [Candidatus Dojkabacteria bacterium]